MEHDYADRQDGVPFRHAASSLVRQVRSALNPSAHKSVRRGQPASGWLAVTVVCEPSALDAAQLPTPLAELGDQIEARIRPTPDSKGTAGGQAA